MEVRAVHLSCDIVSMPKQLNRLFFKSMGEIPLKVVGKIQCSAIVTHNNVC
jgi:hypothetical protein